MTKKARVLSFSVVFVLFTHFDEFGDPIFVTDVQGENHFSMTVPSTKV